MRKRFLSAFNSISPRFRPDCHRLGAAEYRRKMTVRFAIRSEVTTTATGA